MVKIGPLTAEIFLIWTNVAGTNVAWTNVAWTMVTLTVKDVKDGPRNLPSKLGQN